ncbi:hypothetical protein [Leptospira interrogans]|uniref:hypothetical protein n=1 Tax=Leptospira interrogans TaxID=173 RepID=UPI000774B984|nr:hypothetical protein [Leptospira interrogans]
MHLYIFPIIATIFFFVSSSLFGENLKLDLEQTNEILKHIQKDHRIGWENLETQIDFNLLKDKINKGSKSEVLKIFNEIKQTNRLKNLHQVDFNQDGKLDLIYDPENPTQDFVLIFLNTSKGYKLLYNRGGMIVDFKRSQKFVTFYIKAPSCCCLQYGSLEILNFDFDSNQLKSQISVSYSGVLHQPTQLEYFKRFKVSKNSAKLRTASVIDDKEIPDPCSDQKIQGNRIDLYNTNFEGFALSNKLNEKQMPDWYFVLIPYPYIKDKVYNLGWFQKQDLELIDTK